MENMEYVLFHQIGKNILLHSICSLLNTEHNAEAGNSFNLHKTWTFFPERKNNNEDVFFCFHLDTICHVDSGLEIELESAIPILKFGGIDRKTLGRHIFSFQTF